MSEVKKIKLPQKNTVREFDRWRKEITDATNANAEAIHSYYELAKTALNAHAKLKKRVEQLEDIKDGLELDKELHQGTSTTIPLEEYTKKREQSDTQQEGYWECRQCDDKPDISNCINKSLKFLCIKCRRHDAVEFTPSPTEAAEAWRCPECGSDDWGDGTCNACGYTPWDGDETPEAEEPDTNSLDLEATREWTLGLEVDAICDKYDSSIRGKDKETEQLKGKLQQVAFLVADWVNLCVEGSLDAHKLEKIQAAMRD